ncbi:MAG: hypothetical protein JOY99_17390 [Sphingomonadaceae bacterium]|nr:hypothetical protein [Sphingomonadaceae bacterium]
MAEPSSPRAGGAIIALTTIAGALVGKLAHQPSIGILVGFAIGVIVSLLIWRADAKRGN